MRLAIDLCWLLLALTLLPLTAAVWNRLVQTGLVVKLGRMGP
jgi:hypothetical protein